MNASKQTLLLTLPIFELSEDESYSIETVARLTGLPRHQIAVYCRHGLVSTLTPPERDGWRFDLEAVRALRQLEGMRASFELNIAGLRVMKRLMREVERLRADARDRRLSDP